MPKNAAAPESEFHRGTLSDTGRVVVPAPLRALLGLKPGDQVLIRFVAGHLELHTQASVVARAQQVVASAGKRKPARRSRSR